MGLLNFINWLLHNILYVNIDAGLRWVPPLIMALIFALLALVLRGWMFGLSSLIGMLAIQSMRWWPESMDTLSLVIIATGFAILFAIPIGILATRSTIISKVVKPLMDLMQTMPAFVYLLPTLFFFGIGQTPGLVSTIIFALPPTVRLTELGIRQADRELVEAGHAFGATPWQILTKIQIPLAMPTIMAGINQTIMLSLSITVLAGVVGAGGLGGAIYGAITELNVAKGFSGGLCIVILAIYIDRLSAAFGGRSKGAHAAMRRRVGRKLLGPVQGA